VIYQQPVLQGKSISTFNNSRLWPTYTGSGLLCFFATVFVVNYYILVSYLIIISFFDKKKSVQLDIKKLQDKITFVNSLQTLLKTCRKIANQGFAMLSVVKA
jgi:hypothetical protein